MPQKIWRFFLILIGGLTIWYLSLFLKNAYSYRKLDSEIKVCHVDWQVVKLKKNQFQLLGSYKFNFKNKVYAGESFANEKPGHNAYAFFAQKERLEKEEIKVFFNSKNPNINKLYKKFPWKPLIYTFILVGLLIYFAALTRYVGTKHER